MPYRKLENPETDELSSASSYSNDRISEKGFYMSNEPSAKRRKPTHQAQQQQHRFEIDDDGDDGDYGYVYETEARGRRGHDEATAEKILTLERNWEAVLPKLVDAYFEYVGEND
ncbi:hypothetical protein ABG067_008168, partial [Albugo candida]